MYSLSCLCSLCLLLFCPSWDKSSNSGIYTILSFHTLESASKHTIHSTAAAPRYTPSVTPSPKQERNCYYTNQTCVSYLDYNSYLQILKEWNYNIMFLILMDKYFRDYSSTCDLRFCYIFCTKSLKHCRAVCFAQPSS